MTDYVGRRKECNIVDDYMDFNTINPCKDKYRFEIPNIGICCKAYSESKRIDGKYWIHYPFCKIKNCPIIYPKLLEGAELLKI